MPYAVVTGATQGLGKAIAERLLTNGFSIATCSRDQQKIQVLQNEWIEKFPEAKIVALHADLSIKEDIFRFADNIITNFPFINILVNNAGLFQPGNIADEPEDLLETLLSVNLLSAYHLTRKLLSAMKKHGSGHIFNMCSVASLKAYPNGGSYSITKYALMGFSENLREELKPDNIKVTAICPGATYTPSWEKSRVEPQRIMEANDVANILWSAYILSPQANVETIVMRPVKGDL